MNDAEIERIAAAINVARPDWPLSSLITLLKRPELAYRPRRDVFVALAWVASETATQTPARVIEAGPWWKAVAVDSSQALTRYPPKRGEDCTQHPGEWPDSCRGCASERLAPVHEIRSDTRFSAVDVRAQLRIATSGLCSHGVAPDHCLQKHDQDEPEEAS